MTSVPVGGGSSEPYRVLIVGLGRIGMGYDYDKDPAQFVLTHARAFQQHQAYRLVGGVDSAPDRHRLFEERFHCRAFVDVESALSALDVDVVVIAVPTSEHASVAERVLSLARPRALLCEKPLTANVEAARRLVEACRARQCAVFVNYMRRSDVTTADIRSRLDAGLIEGPLRGVVWYSKGLYNSASHFVNLCQHLLGAVKDAGVLKLGGPIAAGPDPEPDFHVGFERGEVAFLASRTRGYFHNTVEWVAANGRLRYEAGGAAAFWEPTGSDGLFAGYTVLSPRAERLPADFQRIQWHVADQLAVCLAGGKGHVCRGDEALSTLEVLSRIEGDLWVR